MEITFTPSEVELVLSSLYETLVKKREAFEVCSKAGLKFAPKDFGIPQLNRSSIDCEDQ